MSFLIGSCWLQAQGLQNVKEDVQYDTLGGLKIIAHYSGLIICISKLNGQGVFHQIVVRLFTQPLKMAALALIFK